MSIVTNILFALEIGVILFEGKYVGVFLTQRIPEFRQLFLKMKVYL